MSANFPKSQYLLSVTPRDEEHERLSIQHTCLRKAFDGKLILAPIELNAGDEILECGVGTGAWVMDCARTYAKGVKYLGIDIDTRLFPSELVENVKFTTGSVTSLPSQWSGRFKLVHQRLLVASLKAKEWPAVIQGFHRIIRPGGFIELCEVANATGGPKTERLFNILVQFFAAVGKIAAPAYMLPQMLREAGFINIHVEKRPMYFGSWAGEDGEKMRENILGHHGVYQAYGKPIINAGGFGVRTVEEYEQLVADSAKEVDRTPGANLEYWVVYGQKP